MSNGNQLSAYVFDVCRMRCHERDGALYITLVRDDGVIQEISPILLKQVMHSRDVYNNRILWWIPPYREALAFTYPIWRAFFRDAQELLLDMNARPVIVTDVGVDLH